MEDVCVRSYVNDRATFTDEQEVMTRSWYLPTKTVESLRAYVIGQFGTTQHIGTICTRSMLNWQADEPDDELHQTWTRLQNDYEYNDPDVATWNYRRYVNYTTVDREDKTALGFSAPVSVISEFTEDLNKNEYGSELANAVEAELRKRAQIAAMQTRIANDRATRVEVDATSDAAPKVEVTEGGDRADLATITIDDRVALSQEDFHDFAETTDVDWANRRGLLAAAARARKMTPKNLIYSIDETTFGVEKTRSKRKDINAILEQARSDDEPLCIAPAKLVMDEMSVHNLQQTVGLTNRRQPLSFDDDEAFAEFIQTVYNREQTTATQMWEYFGTAVADIAYQLTEVEWDVSDEVTAVYKGIHYRNALERYLPFIQTVQKVAEREQEDNELNALIARLDVLIDGIQGALDDVNSHSVGMGRSINEAYERFKEEGETPTSLEFNTKGRLRSGRVLSL